MANEAQSVPFLLRTLANEGVRLLRQEIRLAQAETNQKIGQVQGGVVLLVIAAMWGLVGFLVMVEALVIGISNFIAPWLAALIVGAFVAFIGVILALIGRSRLKPQKLVPERTIRSLRSDVVTIKEQVNELAR